MPAYLGGAGAFSLVVTTLLPRKAGFLWVFSLSATFRRPEQKQLPDHCSVLDLDSFESGSGSSISSEFGSGYGYKVFMTKNMKIIKIYS
jgi:hypothetical protein